MEVGQVSHSRSRVAALRAGLALVVGALALWGRPASAQSSSSGPVAQDTKPAKSAQGALPAASKTEGKASGKRTASGKRAAPAKMSAKARIAAEIGTASQQIRRAMVVQDTATLADLWGEEYTFTSLSGETYSKSERLESVMSPAFLVDEAAEVLPSELDIVRVYGNVAVVQSQLAPPGTAKSGSRGGRAKLLSVWVRESDGRWRTVAAQATAVDVPLPAPSKKKK
jgi:ketosteroid isomerase-like protein